jgi:hypothetical protein
VSRPHFSFFLNEEVVGIISAKEEGYWLASWSFRTGFYRTVSLDVSPLQARLNLCPKFSARALMARNGIGNLELFSGRAPYVMATTIDKDEGTVLEISERALPYSFSGDSYTPGSWVHEVGEWSSTVSRTYHPLALLKPLGAHLLVTAALPADYHYGFDPHSSSFDLSIRIFSPRHKTLRSLLCPLSSQEIRADERCTDTLQASPWNGAAMSRSALTDRSIRPVCLCSQEHELSSTPFK